MDEGEQQRAQLDELESDREFVGKIRVLEYGTYKDELTVHLADPNNLLNIEAMRDELSLRTLTIQQNIHIFVKSIIKLYQERAD